ncbi:hypothetical protein E3N88_09210 [Mikania micrantha]|uniref:Uncharacterized protein n=1 Tax=Mikania micrantha TaxID=192012 RepID=A0A5N6PIH1_9ASTR|nr:hypothetical protein E3N88_09210 [Mikania micrantha]
MQMMQTTFLLWVRIVRAITNNLPRDPKRGGGAKRRLFLVDEDEDEYDETFQDVNRVDMELDFLKDDDNEGDFVKSQENENEVQTNDSDDELGNEDDILIQERLQEIPESKKRGPTMLPVVRMRKVDDREIIICNEFGQSVGPVTNEKDVVGRFSRFLGTIARNHSYAPLIHSSWHKVPHKDKIWEYVLDILTSYINADLRKKHFYQFRDNKTRWKNRPKNIPEGDFAQLLRLWNNTNVKKRCLRAKEMRMSQKNMHTAGPKSFARIRDEKEQMKKYKSSENESASIDPFMIVINKENNGYCRLNGRGVTNRLIKKINCGDTTNMFPEGIMESFNASFEGQKNELLEMIKELDEEHERKRIELEAIQLDIKNQQEHLEATMQKLMEQLPLKD